MPEQSTLENPTTPEWPDLTVSARKSAVGGPFGRKALNARQYGLAVLPCGGAEGKKPLTKWRTIIRPQSERQIEAMLARPSLKSANLGIITGASGITVIDCDTPGKRLELEALFGETPIVIGTPRGGLHLYYQSNGEHSGPIEIDGMKIDVKGLGGFIVAPPSMRTMPDGAVRGYNFLEGGWDWLASLPEIKPGALPAKFYRHVPSATEPASGSVPVGERNTTLFNALRSIARGTETQADLLQKALKINGGFAEPLQAREVEATVGSVWGYKESGTLVGASAPALLIPAPVQGVLCSTKNGADAFMLLGVLMVNHGARTRRGESFAIAVEAMIAAGKIKGWGVKRYRGAIQVLIASGLIARTHKGGARPGDAHVYTFGAVLTS
jgi:hypothetical protein